MSIHSHAPAALHDDPITEFNRIFAILEWLNNKTWGLMERGSCSQSYNEVFNHKKPMAQGKLANIAKDLQSDLQVQETVWSGCHVYLPPLWEGPDIVPIIWLKCDLHRGSPELRIYLEIYALIGGELKGVGLRFETSESLDDNATPANSVLHRSRHDYLHVQLTNDRIHNGPQWVPDHVPCLPAVAHCPLALMLCLLRSFYDKVWFAKIVNQTNIPPTYLNSLRAHNLLT